MPFENNFIEFLWLFKNIEKILNKKLTEKPKLLYRGSRDGFSSEDFHEKCDEKKNILILVENEFKKKFGGFAEKPFTTDNIFGFLPCDRAFLFSVDKKFISKVKISKQAMHYNKNRGPIFSGDLNISSNCNSNWDSHTFYFGHVYALPKGISKSTPEARAFLSGCKDTFKVLDYEAWECC